MPYKRIDLIVSAFRRMPDKRLVVIGDGPEASAIRAKAGPNVEFLGYQPFDVLRDHMQRAKAFVFAAQEDFGIIPLEAQACGTPAIIFSGGAASETIRGLDHAAPTGVFFDEQTEEAIIAAVGTFEANPAAIAPQACRANAERFSELNFILAFTSVVEEQWARHRGPPRHRLRTAETADDDAEHLVPG